MAYGRKSAKNALISFFLAVIIFFPLTVYSEIQKPQDPQTWPLYRMQYKQKLYL